MRGEDGYGQDESASHVVARHSINPQVIRSEENGARIQLSSLNGMFF